MSKQDFTPYQQKVIKRYYDHADTLQLQKLATTVGDLYLAEGKKRAKLWQAAAATMLKLGVPQARIDHLLAQGKPELLAQVVKELEGK